MAKRFKKGLEAPVRGVIHAGLRAGLSRTQIYEQVEEQFGIGNTRKYQEKVREAERRLAGAAQISQMNLRKKPDWKQALGCEGDVRVYISLTWRATPDDAYRTVGYSAVLVQTGSLAQQLNRVINEVREFYIDKKYDIPELTSANKPSRSPNSFYRVEYAECV